MMEVCTPPVHMEGVGSGLRTFAKPHQGVRGSVRGGAEHVLLRSARCPVLLSTITSTSCPPSRPFFTMALLPSPFPTMRPTILPGAWEYSWAVGRMTRRCVHGCWAACRAKGTGAHERHQLALLALSSPCLTMSPPILPRSASQQPAWREGGGQGGRKARSWAVGSSIEPLLELEGLGEV
eukprot:COSAG02_NODE_2219_length_9474_cov_21.763840_1_plen_180_part_00